MFNLRSRLVVAAATAGVVSLAMTPASASITGGTPGFSAGAQSARLSR